MFFFFFGPHTPTICTCVAVGYNVSLNGSYAAFCHISSVISALFNISYNSNLREFLALFSPLLSGVYPLKKSGAPSIQCGKVVFCV